ncbi:Gfo/Idh/MocA family protein [Clostridium lacusfryxellense]|uniref:Gfo/Idh/MocA family protein n=1 Tax=Clostridium lacusfryxellense TaxID=205328 RepID=UPI001C0C9AF4|nr:Gfo/Idh/MocA family oxidoreductase [Clostridium lacusfryxellense]MBU3113284.1 Gfo/Idh/MocA family oxidoreductase [Clostridium lacusfryxellense]
MQSEKKIRIGIIGCGGIANGKHMPALKALSNVEMVAFCDLVLEKADKAAKEYGSVGAKVYTDYNELLQDETIDVIHVLTPNKSHAKLSIASMKAGKHVMCEKPMAKTSVEALEMVNVAKETGKKLTIGYQHRHKAESTYLKKAIDRGDLGEIYFAKATAVRRRGTPTWGVFLNEEEQGGGPLIDIGTHSLDLTLWLMNNYKPKMVVGTKYKKILDPDCGNPWGPWDIKENTVEDSAFGFIVMENGATIILESSWALNTIEPISEGSTVLCGSKAGAQIKNGLSINKDEFGKLIEIKPDLSAGGVAFYDGVAETPSIVEAKRWIDSILNDTEVVVKPYEAYIVSKILEAIYESAEAGKAIYL